ncbi:MAG: nucleotide pyrophosphohydrolase [Candidatus Accumulibacter sp.]|jgi:NTP pyrophosphatase (non-canonical NTP hydrolase)|nr:nucleotide pyrophosphohydrolase [Accumulibacter sp.]
MDLGELTRALAQFRDERDWARFHTLRNLIVSLNLEAAELLELTQWKDDAGVAALLADNGGLEALRDECADVLLYLLMIAEKGGFDLLDAAAAKLEKNARRYPVEACRGSSRKYTQFGPAAPDTRAGRVV